MQSAQKIPVFVISLVRDADRRATISAHLNKFGVEFEFVDAVEGKALPAGEIEGMLAPGASMTPGQVGCYLSHLETYRRIVERKIPVSLILEDDARLSVSALKLLRSDLGESPPFDYCFLDSENFNDKGPIFYDSSKTYPLGGAFEAHPLSHGPLTTHAFLISGAAAQKRLDHGFPIHWPIDMYDHLPYPISFLAVIRPKLAWLGELGIQSSTFERHSGVRVSLRFMKKSHWYYRVRELLLLKRLTWMREVREAQRQGRISPDRAWKRMPSGRQIITE